MAIIPSNTLDGLEQPDVMPAHVRRVTDDHTPTKAMLDWEEFTHFFYKSAINGVDTRITLVQQDFADEIVKTHAMIRVEEIARADANGAIARRIDTIEATYQTADAALAASIVTESTARVTADVAFAQELQTITADFQQADEGIKTSVTTLLTSERLAWSDADGALGRRIDNIAASYALADAELNATLSAQIHDEQVARASALEAVATDILELDTRFQAETELVRFDVNALFAEERVTRSAADGALSARITDLDAAYKSADAAAAIATNAAIHEEQVARSDAVDAVVADIQQLEASFDIQLADERSARTQAIADSATIIKSDALAATTLQINAVRSDYQSADNSVRADLGALITSANAAITNEAATRAAADSAEAATRQELRTEFNAIASAVNAPTAANNPTFAALLNEQTARAAGDSALSTRTTVLETGFNNPTISNNPTWARLITEETTRAAADTSVANRTTVLEAATFSPSTTNNPVYASFVNQTNAQTSFNNVTVSNINDLYARDTNRNARLVVEEQVSAIHGVRFGVNGYINGTTGGFVFTGALRNDGSVQYNMEFWSNVTIYGDLIVKGSLTASKYQNGSISQMAGANTGTYPGQATSVTVYVRANAKVLISCALTDTSGTMYSASFRGSMLTRYFPIQSSYYGTIGYLVAVDTLIDFQYLGGSAYAFWKGTQPTSAFAIHYQPDYDGYVTFSLVNASPGYCVQWISATEITG